MKQFGFAKIVQGPLVAVIAGILLNLAFNNVESMKLNNEQVVRLPVWKLNELPANSIALEPSTDGIERFQTRTIKEGPIYFQDAGGKYYAEGVSESSAKGLTALPSDLKTERLEETTENGRPRFQTTRIKDGPVYYKGKNGLYHLDAPMFIFPHFQPSAIKSAEMQFGHGSHGAGHGDEKSAEELSLIHI